MSTENLDSADLKAVPRGGWINEDVMQQIFDISRIPLPISDSIGTDGVSNSYTEWPLDDLGAVDITNAKVDGQDTNNVNDTTVGERVGNHCQISTKTIKVSTRARDSDNVATGDQFARQVMRAQQKLRRDVEAISMLNQASLADDGNATAGRAGGINAWLETNTSNGATGSDGGFNPATGIVDAATPGTQRGLTETLVRDISEEIYIEGGNPTILQSTPRMIRRLSEYMFGSSARIATIQRDEQGQVGTAMGSVNVFITDHGVVLRMISNRLQQLESGNASVFLLDPEYVTMGILTGFRTEPLDKTGLADNAHVIVDWTVKMLTEKAHGVIRALDPNAAVVT